MSYPRPKTQFGIWGYFPFRNFISPPPLRFTTKPVFSSYPELLDIVQLDGPLDNSDIEAEDEVALEDNDFLGMINAEAIRAGSSAGDSPSSSSDSDAVDELADVVEEVCSDWCKWLLDSPKGFNMLGFFFFLKTFWCSIYLMALQEIIQ